MESISLHTERLQVETSSLKLQQLDLKSGAGPLRKQFSSRFIVTYGEWYISRLPSYVYRHVPIVLLKILGSISQTFSLLCPNNALKIQHLSLLYVATQKQHFTVRQLMHSYAKFIK